MAVLTKTAALTRSVWVEVTAALSMADGKTYAVEMVGAGVEAVDVTGTDAPASTVRGHCWFPGNHDRAGDYRAFTKKAGQTWWLRPAGANAHVVATEI